MWKYNYTSYQENNLQIHRYLKIFANSETLFLDFDISWDTGITKSININKMNRVFPCPVPEGRETGRFIGI